MLLQKTLTMRGAIQALRSRGAYLWEFPHSQSIRKFEDMAPYFEEEWGGTPVETHVHPEYVELTWQSPTYSMPLSANIYLMPPWTSNGETEYVTYLNCYLVVAGSVWGGMCMACGHHEVGVEQKGTPKERAMKMAIQHYRKCKGENTDV